MSWGKVSQGLKEGVLAVGKDGGFLKYRFYQGNLTDKLTFESSKDASHVDI